MHRPKGLDLALGRSCPPEPVLPPTRRKRRLPGYAAWIALLFFAACNTREVPVEARAGALDLSSRDSAPGYIFNLTGYWEFFPDRFVEPGQSQAAGEAIRVPATWNDQWIAGKPFGGVGAGTYRLRIKLPAETRELAIKTREQGTAFRLYANGALIYANGQPALTADNARPFYRSGVAVFSVDGRDLELVAHVANFQNNWGGLWNPLLLGTPENILARHERDIAADLVAFGMLLIMAIYHLSLFVFRPADRSTLYFSLFCLVIALRTVLVGERLITHYLPEIDWSLAYRLEYWTFCVSAPLWVLFLRELYPAEFFKPVWPALAGLSLAFFGLVLLTPLAIYSAWLWMFQLTIVAAVIYAFYMTMLALVRGRDGSLLFTVGWTLLAATILMDILASRGWVESTPLLPFGLLAFIFVQALMLARRLSRAFRTVEEFSAGLEQKVAERTRDLERARHEAEESSRAKSAFLSTMSHEIRTPMNSIIGAADLLADLDLPDKDYQYVRLLKRSGQQLLMLVNEVLDIARIEEGRLQLERASFSPAEVLDQSSSLMRIRGRGKDLVVRTEVAPGIPAMLVGDATRVEQILVNLIGNAVKFTHRGEVVATVRPAPERAGERVANRVWLEFEVRDTGIGIPEDRLEFIFDRFAQLDSSASRPYGGSGLGLAICRGLVEAMGGEIHVESEVGRGSRFRAILPFDRPDDATAPAHPGAEKARPTLPVAHILVVEDNEDNRFLLSAFLKSEPVRVDFANDGQVALEKVHAEKYDLILMDIQMPVMDGLTATRRIRAWESAEARQRTPIVALSANARKEDLEQSLEAGCDRHLSKPISKNMLLEAMATYIATPRRTDLPAE